MPNPNQLPFPGQKKPLSVERVQVSLLLVERVSLG
jgi:hypothetical protein